MGDVSTALSTALDFVLITPQIPSGLGWLVLVVSGSLFAVAGLMADGTKAKASSTLSIILCLAVVGCGFSIPAIQVLPAVILIGVRLFEGLCVARLARGRLRRLGVLVCVCTAFVFVGALLLPSTWGLATRATWSVAALVFAMRSVSEHAYVCRMQPATRRMYLIGLSALFASSLFDATDFLNWFSDRTFQSFLSTVNSVSFLLGFAIGAFPSLYLMPIDDIEHWLGGRRGLVPKRVPLRDDEIRLRRRNLVVVHSVWPIGAWLFVLGFLPPAAAGIAFVGALLLSLVFAIMAKRLLRQEASPP